MGFFMRFLVLTAGLALLETVYAKLDLSSNSTVVVYWGQDSYKASGGDIAQKRLGDYCDDSNIDVIVMAFLMTINGPGGAPEVDFGSTSKGCDTFNGTNLKNCPEIGEDITKCQSKDKTIILSIGGATYSEGGFKSDKAADDGANLIWSTFGPDKGDSKIPRPFGKAVVDGFDFDFEAAVTHMGKFATKLRSLADADKSKKYYLTAAPQCPFPDAADKDILNTDNSAAVDAVFVQFYNNFCGVNAYTPEKPKDNATKAEGSGSRTAAQNFNFDVWDKWALQESKNKDVRVFLGVPANKGAASTGYLPIESLEPVIQYSKGFESFGGVMMWDVSQAYPNKGFLDGVKKALGKKGAQQQSAHGSSSDADAAAPSPAPKPPQQEQQQQAEQGHSDSAEEHGTQPASQPSQVSANPSPGEQPNQNQDQADDHDQPPNLLNGLLSVLGGLGQKQR
ncbi:hypothetical protein ASPVEDRAFT_34190 [Aspergillus versicolor CBS 583.65]|uniref:chitinase n=1 Tax=Aspergillus versicolor CBS 583.65 TaxID=1036611 RepID=A0A1L9Q2M5_ASPVE|nr:uncharacterized protein ASPVEDRAFT_34190 [Aspergillus versicolor CBS 583.65]OJJ08013.1 hypothetical protein ASPVEDRAFT_34190 [Aspergillus versicolor CBS 583.65]